MTIMQHLGMFVMGVRDSVSLQWVKKTLLYVDPQTKRVHPSSKVLFDSLKSSLIKIVLYTIIVPLLIGYLDFLPISTLLKIVYLILTYGYLFFYNNDILVSSRKLLAWQEKRTPGGNFQLDKNEKIQFFTQLSSQVKSFIFLLFYYVPIFLIETQVLTYIPYLGTFMLILSESFFNGVFYFMKTWPFDKYNIGFMEKNMSYMVGYGFTVSVVCNYFLSGSMATGAYLVLSLWMLINSVIYSPPLIQFNSFDDILKILANQNERNILKNAYNQHRLKMRKDAVYREYIIRKIFVVYPALKITQLLNKKVSVWIKNQSISTNQDDDIKQQGSEETQLSQKVSTKPVSEMRGTIEQVDEKKQEEIDVQSGNKDDKES